MQIEERLRTLEHCVEQSITKEQFELRSRVFNRILTILDESHGNDSAAYARMIAEWTPFVAFELNSKEGLPLFYSPWQERAYNGCLQYDDVFLLCARQVGKTTFAATEALRRMMQENNRSILLIAPTVAQLIVRDEFNRFRNQSPFIQEHFVRGGRTAIDTTEFSTNGSRFIAMNLSQKTEGDNKVGNTGTDIILDEIQNFSKKSYEESVMPMLSSAFTKRRLLRIGTVKLRHRIDFDKYWATAQNSEYVFTMTVNCWDAIDEGIRIAKFDPHTGRTSPQSMTARFNELGIDCPAVNKNGACPVFLPHLYDELEQDGIKKPGKDWTPGEFRCPYSLACMKNDAYITEDLAQFPTSSSRFFPREWLVALRRNYKFYTPRDIAQTVNPLYVSCDVGGIVDEGEVAIGEMVIEDGITKMKIIGHETIEPFRKQPGVVPSDAPTINTLKRIYKNYRPKRLYIDSTHNFQLISALSTGEDAIPPAAIFANAPAENQGTRGVYFSPLEKAKMYDWYRTCIGMERIIVPDEGFEPDFWGLFYESHIATKLRENSQATYSTFEPHKLDHLPDSMCMLGIPLYSDAGLPPISEIYEVTWSDLGL